LVYIYNLFLCWSFGFETYYTPLSRCWVRATRRCFGSVTLTVESLERWRSPFFFRSVVFHGRDANFSGGAGVWRYPLLSFYFTPRRKILDRTFGHYLFDLRQFQVEEWRMLWTSMRCGVTSLKWSSIDRLIAIFNNATEVLQKPAPHLIFVTLRPAPFTIFTRDTWTLPCSRARGFSADSYDCDRRSSIVCR
jgi:hypothetical protein